MNTAGPLISRSASLDAYLTHYLVLHLPDGRDIAVGEAGKVEQRGPSGWYAHVGYWAIDAHTGEPIPHQFSEVAWREVSSPRFRVVRKEQFKLDPSLH